MAPLPPIRLDPSEETPLYRQLFEQLRGWIHTGRLSRGQRLPATRELAGLLGLNRATVAAAYELLENEGLLRGHVGRGSFVDGSAAEAAPAAPRISWDQAAQEPLGVAAPVAPVLAQPAISFASSRPAEDLFPLDEFRQTCREVIDSPTVSSILQLGSPAGYEPLRQWLLERADPRASDDILITSGCQQALDLLARLLVQPGDAVAVEDPVYPGLQSVFAACRARLLAVPVGPAGMRVDALEALLRREPPKLLVITPDFQNPTGATVPLPERRRILQLARQAGVIVVENGIYHSLRYTGNPLASLKSLDETGDVVAIGSFSKLAFPGLRVGWILGNETLIARLTLAKQNSDLHSDQLSQAVLDRFARSGRLQSHIQQVCRHGAQRLRTALECCRRFLPEGSSFTEPEGGMSLWVRLPDPLDAAELLPAAERAGVSYLPGRYFTVSRPEPGAFRLCFAGVAPARIRAGMAALGSVLAAEQSRLRVARRQEPLPALV